jgi:energy-coupling factor transporter ATP-binding protein EcfA2
MPAAPFRGLYAFQAQDREFFFGREALVERLRSRLAEHRFLAVVGLSGGGKSSLVLAGLVPELRVESAYLRPGHQPRSALRHALATVPGRAAVIVVDRFEELFTLCTDEHERRAFLDELLARIGEAPVVVTMRADFWGGCAPYERLRGLMQAHQELIPPMAATELRRVMELQTKAVGLRFEAELGATVLEDVQGEPGAMPLLQHALRELWQRRRGQWLRSEEYRAIGEVREAITHTADDVYRRLSPDDRALAREIFLRLTRVDDAADPGEPRDARQRLRLEDLVRSGDDLARTRTLVKRLADEGARLVVTGIDPSAAPRRWRSRTRR